MKSLKIKESICLGCGVKLDAATSTDGDFDPQPGSISICAYCGSIAIFKDDMSLRPFTQEEIDELFDELPDDAREQVLSISEFIKHKRHLN